MFLLQDRCLEGTFEDVSSEPSGRSPAKGALFSTEALRQTEPMLNQWFEFASSGVSRGSFPILFNHGFRNQPWSMCF